MTTLTNSNEIIKTLNDKIEAEKTNINFFKMAIIDWSNRTYKTCNKKVTDEMTEGDKYYGLSVNFINENRRTRTIKGLKEDIASANDRINWFLICIEKEDKKIMDAYYKENPINISVDPLSGLDNLDELFE